MTMQVTDTSVRASVEVQDHPPRLPGAVSQELLQQAPIEPRRVASRHARVR